MSWVIAKWIARNAGIGKVQRGVTTGAGIVTIAPVDMSKAFVISVSKGSAGSVGASGSISLSGNHTLAAGTDTLAAGAGIWISAGGSGTSAGIQPYNSGTKYAGSITLNTRSLSTTAKTISGTQSGSLTPGATNLTVKKYSARIISPTQLQCDGPVEWQVVG